MCDKKLLDWPRNLLPGTNTARAIHQLTDGATFANSWCFFLVTAPKKQPFGSPGTTCWNTDAGSFSCLGSSLNTAILHTQVLIQNISTKIHNLCKDVTAMYPVVVEVYHQGA